MKISKGEVNSVGFNIEIKYADLEEAESNSLHMPELNFYIDKIMELSVTKAKGRKLVFSSFHTDAIIGIRLKQVTFL